MDSRDKRFESVYSNKVRAGKRRTYFFDVRKTRGSDFYLTITESKRKFSGEGFERHKIFLYKEDFHRFMEELENTVNYIKENLMPDYDYDEYARIHRKYKEQQLHADSNEDESSNQNNNKSYEDNVEDDLTW